MVGRVNAIVCHLCSRNFGPDGMMQFLGGIYCFTALVPVEARPAPGSTEVDPAREVRYSLRGLVHANFLSSPDINCIAGIRLIHEGKSMQPRREGDTPRSFRRPAGMRSSFPRTKLIAPTIVSLGKEKIHTGKMVASSGYCILIPLVCDLQPK